MRTLRWLGLLVGWPGMLVASQPNLTPVVFHPGWFPSAQFAGVFLAIDAGLYHEAGLDVELRPFAYGQDATASLQADPTTCTLGSIEGYILLQRLDAGDDLITLRPMLPTSPAGIMTFADSGIQSAADFTGRRIGVHAYADALFAWFAVHAGLTDGEVQFIRVENDVDDLISGHVDAMQGYASEEYVQLQTQAASRQTRFLSFADLGFPSYSEILYTTREQHSRHSETLARFVAATRRGWEETFAQPEDAAQAVLKRMPSDTESGHVLAALAALRPYVMGDTDEALPVMASKRWTQLIAIAREMNLVSGEIAPPASWLK